MKPIVTLTLNPAIDEAAEAEKVRPIRKVRIWSERYDPGGGGINVARVVQELGGTAFALYLSGGATGPVLDELIHASGVKSRRIRVEGPTRVSHTVHERSTGLEFRFVPEGPVLAPAEWRAAFEALDELECEYLVAGGSLPRGVPDDFYVDVAKFASRKGAKLVLDTSGQALKVATAHGVFLIKPSLGELEDLVGRRLAYPVDQERAVRELMQAGAAEIIALTLGRDGALLATRSGLRRLAGVKVKARSAVGAGDSFVAAMTLALAQGRDPEDAFALEAAAGTAAVLTMGRSSADAKTSSGFIKKSSGAHIASIGGTWMALVYGFAGMRDDGGRISFRPRLPDDWSRLAFPVFVRGQLIRVEIDHLVTTYQLSPEALAMPSHSGRKRPISCLSAPSGSQSRRFRAAAALCRENAPVAAQIQRHAHR